MNRQWKISVALAATFAVVVGALLLLSGRGDSSGPDRVVPDQAGEDSILVRDDSRILGDEGEVEFVEFLDFECEACGAAYPVVEQLRADYAGRVTFVVRYFPLPGHFNAERAARAVESAARQDKFEEMYQMMYETQAGWGEQREPLDDLFRSFAEKLGLDMEQYDADYADPEVAARVQRDVEDGTELGVQGTPTFYVDGELLEPRSYEDFTAALDNALAD
jgi:protein-disulfide isomerase